MKCFHAAALSAAALHLHFLGLVLMAMAMFMREVVEVEQGILHPVQ